MNDLLKSVVPAAAGPGAIQWLNAASNVAGALRAPSAGPSEASGGYVDAGNNAGWTVATGGSSASGAPSPWLFVGVAAVGLVLLVAWKRLAS